MTLSITRKRTGLLLTVTAAILLVGAIPSVSRADDRWGRGGSRNDNRRDSRQYDRRDDRRDNNRHDSNRFGFSFLFGSRPQPVYVAPAPVVVQPVPNQVWVPDRWVDESTQPVYETRHDAFGKPYTVMTQAGYTRRVFVPGHYETVNSAPAYLAPSSTYYVQPAPTYIQPAPSSGGSIHIGGRF